MKILKSKFMNEAIAIFVLIVIFMAIMFAGWFIYHRARSKERMALIEKDKEVSDLYTRKKMNFSFPWLKIGIIATGFSIGLIAVEIIMQVFFINQDGNYSRGGDTIGIGILFLFTSISILVAYFVDKPKNKE